MKLYHGQYILPALAAFLLVATFPVWRGLAARRPDFQSPPNPKGERWGKLQFRAEVFNVLNNVNLGQPITTLNAGANFGRITSAASPRIVQFGLKYLF